MNILVTGSEGFIGSNLCKYITSQSDNKIIGLDIKPECKNNKYSKFYIKNLADDNLDDIFNDNQIDAVVHMASDMRHEPYTVEVVHNNLVGTEKLLKKCVEHNVSVYVQMSSLPVIGTPNTHPIKENHSLNPPTVYHVTKLSQEYLANYETYKSGLRTVSLRISAPVGIGVNPKTIFPTFVKKAINNEDIVLYGEGSRKQTYIHVNDIAQAILKCINSKACGVYNLSSYNLYSNYELAKKCVETLDSQSNIIFNNQPDVYDGVVWDVDINKIRNDSGFEPRVDIEQAIKELADYFRSTKE